MITVELFLIVACAVFFYRIATMEHRSGPIWCAASLAASAAAMLVIHVHMLIAQAALFAIMWFLNCMKPDKKTEL